MLALIGLSILRLGVPLAVTVLITWGLKSLDARWQAEAEARQASASVEAGQAQAIAFGKRRKLCRRLVGHCAPAPRPDGRAALPARNRGCPAGWHGSRRWPAAGRLLSLALFRLRSIWR